MSFIIGLTIGVTIGVICATYALATWAMTGATYRFPDKPIVD